jgi:sulfate adenylyltransferase (EC 2.7.7.4)
MIEPYGGRLVYGVVEDVDRAKSYWELSARLDIKPTLGPHKNLDVPTPQRLKAPVVNIHAASPLHPHNSSMAPRRLSHMIHRLLHLPVYVWEIPSKDRIGVHN